MSNILTGNVQNMVVASLTIDVASVSTITTAEQTFTLKGLQVGDLVFTAKPSSTTGVVIGSARVSAADTIAIQFVNPTAGSVNPAEETYLVLVVRPDGAPRSSAQM